MKSRESKNSFATSKSQKNENVSKMKKLSVTERDVLWKSSSVTSTEKT